MIPENKLRQILLILLSATLLVYIVVVEIVISIASTTGSAPLGNLIFAIKIVSFAVSISVALLTAKSSMVARFFLRKKYIAGTYEGVARKIDSNNELLTTHQEKMVIIQNLLSIKVSGESKNSRNGYYAKYYGFSVYANEDIDYYEFMIKTHTNRSNHTDILELTIRDGELKGYLPGRSGKWNIDLKKSS